MDAMDAMTVQSKEVRTKREEEGEEDDDLMTWKIPSFPTYKDSWELVVPYASIEWNAVSERESNNWCNGNGYEDGVAKLWMKSWWSSLH